MTSNIGFAGRIAIFEIGAAALVAVVALSIPKPRPVKGFEQIALNGPAMRSSSNRCVGLTTGRWCCVAGP